MNARHINYLVDQYVEAKDIIINEGFADELDWQDNLEFKNHTENDFLREAAWVILSSGMRETTVRSKFEAISSAFLNFENATNIVSNAEQCRTNALECFRHTGKINAILSLAFRVYIEGYSSIKKSVDFYGINYLQSFDFIGPATSYHLAKNIGLQVSKPDRHLCRVAYSNGFKSVEDMCKKISLITGDSIPVVDLVIWRFATIRSDYLSWFKSVH